MPCVRILDNRVLYGSSQLDIEPEHFALWNLISETSASPSPSLSASSPLSSTSDSSTTSRQRRGDPNHIPRPPNAFLCFRSWYWAEQRKLPSHERNHKNISRLAGEAWQSMTDEQRAPFNQLAEQAKREHMLRYPDYKYTPVGKGSKQKKTSNAENQERGRQLATMIMARDAYDQFQDASFDAFATAPQATFEAIAPPIFHQPSPLPAYQATSSFVPVPATQAPVVPFPSYDMYPACAPEQSQYITPVQVQLAAPVQSTFYESQPFPIMPMHPPCHSSYRLDSMLPVPENPIPPVNSLSAAEYLQAPPLTEAAVTAAAPFEFSTMEELDRYFFPPPSSPCLDSLDLNVWVAFPDSDFVVE